MRGGDHAGATREALARPVDEVALALLSLAEARRLAIGIAAVHRGEARAFLGRQIEICVLQAQRPGDVRSDELVERHSRGLLDDAAENVGVVAVYETVAGLRDEGQRAEPFHAVADRLVLVREIKTITGCRAEALGFIQRGDLRFGAIGNAGGVRQQILERDGALGGSDRQPRAVLVLGSHRGLGEGRDPLAGLVVEGELAFFHQLQDGHAGERLGLRGDAELCVHGHLAAGLLVRPAHGALIDRLAIAQHQRDHARQLAIVHVLIEQRIDARQALHREASAQRVRVRGYDSAGECGSDQYRRHGGLVIHLH